MVGGGGRTTKEQRETTTTAATCDYPYRRSSTSTSRYRLYGSYAGRSAGGTHALGVFGVGWTGNCSYRVNYHTSTHRKKRATTGQRPTAWGAFSGLVSGQWWARGDPPPPLRGPPVRSSRADWLISRYLTP